MSPERSAVFLILRFSKDLVFKLIKFLTVSNAFQAHQNFFNIHTSYTHLATFKKQKEFYKRRSNGTSFNRNLSLNKSLTSHRLSPTARRKKLLRTFYSARKFLQSRINQNQRSGFKLEENLHTINLTDSKNGNQASMRLLQHNRVNIFSDLFTIILPLIILITTERRS